MRSVLPPRPGSATLTEGGTLRLERRFVTVVFVVVALLLAVLAARGPLYAIVGIGLAGLVLIVVVLGRERVAIVAMMAAFATAPMYKGIAPGGESTPITPTDMLFGLAVFLLLPTLVGKPLRLPFPYVLGVLLIGVTGMLATAFADDPLGSAMQFVQWLVVVVGLVGLIAWWSPSWTIVAGLMWSYGLGHVASALYAPIDGGVNGRYLGLTHHPNGFGEAGTMAFAIGMYLWRRSTDLWYRAAVAAVMGAGAAAAITSGSRAATVVIAGLVLMIPFVERSAVRGFVLALLVALGVALIPFLVGSSGDANAISRLAGSADSFVADQARLDAQNLGIQLFLDNPIFGSGFAQAIYAHDIPLGVLSSIGVVGFIGYLVLLYVLARPMIGRHPERRLCYVAWAFIAITPTVPALEDRTLWVPLAPVILVAMRSLWRSPDDTDPAAEGNASDVPDAPDSAVRSDLEEIAR